MRSAARLLAAATLLVAACGQRDGPTGPQEIRLGDSFQLDVGESAIIRSEPLRISFQQVTGDSRCPAGVYCFWQGEIVVSLQLQVAAANPNSFELSTVNRPETRVSGYRIQLLTASSEPYLPGRVTDPHSYRAELVITR